MAAKTVLRGRIKRVYCKNFITYKETQFHPNLYLNVICGPNGTGKSTLVSAIVLGFGGDTKLLARASSIVDYIKNGTQEAIIRIVLFKDNKGNEIQFQRIFNRKGQSEYRIGTEKVTSKLYAAKCREFNVQINNLCQFLPQDRVQEFARMNAQEILENTLVSVCSDELLQTFNKCKELQVAHSQAGNRKAAMEKDLERHRLRLDELQKILDSYSARKVLSNKLQLCNTKRLWLECDEMEKKLAEVAKDFELAQANAKKHKDIVAKLEKEHQQHEENIRRFKRIAQDKKVKYEQQRKMVTASLEKIAELRQRIPKHKASYERKKTEHMRDEKDRQNQELLLTAAQEEYERNVAELQGNAGEQAIKTAEEKLRSLRGQMDEYTKKMSQLRRHLEENYSSEMKYLKMRIEREENTKHNSVEVLRAKHSQTYEAYTWICQNMDRFEGKVYKPVICELNVPNKAHAKYIENVVKMQDLMAIVCENKNDIALLSSELCVQRQLTITIAYGDNSGVRKYRPQEPIEAIRKYGFTDYLVDLVEGPEVILNYLCSLYNLHQIPVGDDRVNQFSDSMPPHITKFYGGEYFFINSVSKYSGAVSSSRTPVMKKNVLVSVNKAEVDQLKERYSRLAKESDKFKNECTGLEAKIEELDHRRKQVLQEKREAETRFQQIQHSIKQYKRMQVAYEQFVARMSNLEQLEKEYESGLKTLLKNLHDYQEDRVEQLRPYVIAFSEWQVANEVAQFHEVESEVSRTLQREKLELHKVLDTRERIESLCRREQKAFRAKEAEALKLSSNMKPSQRNFPHAEAYSQLPDQLPDLKEEMAELNARLDCMEDIDPAIVEEHRDRKAELEDMMRQASDSQKDEKSLLAEMQQKHDEFYPQLSEVVDKINKSFGDFMNSLTYVGEVSIQRNSTFDFTSYGIKILVQYHKDEPLQVLDRFVLSGGERAVAIAIYTLSLQNLTYVPFRCVDEINQGMDAANEAKIFDMLVREATKDNCAQFFFVTPKPLPRALWENPRLMGQIVYNAEVRVRGSRSAGSTSFLF